MHMYKNVVMDTFVTHGSFEKIKHYLEKLEAFSKKALNKYQSYLNITEIFSVEGSNSTVSSNDTI